MEYPGYDTFKAYAVKLDDELFREKSYLRDLVAALLRAEKKDGIIEIQIQCGGNFQKIRIDVENGEIAFLQEKN